MTASQEEKTKQSSGSSKTWEEITEKAEKDAGRVNESFRYYRGAAIGLSITMVGVAAGVLASLEELSAISLTGRFWLIVLFSSVILFSCFLQYLNYWGHYRLAHYLMWASMVNSANAFGPPLTEENKKRLDDMNKKATILWRSHNRYFRVLDVTLHFSFWLLVGSVVYLAFQLVQNLVNADSLTMVQMLS